MGVPNGGGFELISRFFKKDFLMKLVSERGTQLCIAGAVFV